jgi:hypothetical protein
MPPPKVSPEEIRKILTIHERSARLLKNDDFLGWKQDLEENVKKEGLDTLQPGRSNFDRAMATGILGFVKELFNVMGRQANPETLKKMRKRLKEAEDARDRRAGEQREPARYAGISGIGQF